MRSVFITCLGSRVTVCVVLASVVFASRAWLISAWGSPLPFWDQWDAEVSLYRAWLTDKLQFSDLIAAHNEHRILLTRVADLALFVACDGWNPWAQLLLNGALHAAAAAVLASVFGSVLSGGPRAAFLVGLALLFTSTAGWQNALWGFQSQVYFTNLLSAGALAGLATAAPWSRRWCIALGGLALALFGNAAGLLGAMAGMIAAWPRHSSQREWTGWGAVAAVVGLGLLLRVTVPQHEALHARSVGQFLAVLARGLSWPHVDASSAWAGVHLPLVVVCIARWRRRKPFDGLERAALALVVFSALNAAAIAFGRGAGLPEMRPLSRYHDPLLLGVAAQLFLMVHMAHRWGRIGRIVAVGWSAFIAAGLLQLTTLNLSVHLPFKQASDTAGLAQVRAYLSSGDATVFSRTPGPGGLHPDPASVIRVLDDPVLQEILPAEFRGAAAAPWLVTHAPMLTWISLAAFIAAIASPHRAGPGRNAPPLDNVTGQPSKAASCPKRNRIVEDRDTQ
jgi:hypothetical protein